MLIGNLVTESIRLLMQENKPPNQSKVTVPREEVLVMGWKALCALAEEYSVLLKHISENQALFKHFRKINQ